MIKYILEKITTSSIFLFIGLLLFGKNQKLYKDNKKLNEELKDSKELINKKNKIINVVKNNKPKSISDNIERMRKGKL